ncbi:MAG: pantoate--beta-alanine ligase [Bacteroidales bacterium]|nr:pantoate--beta-alanine ligase [Bacteroidales bacterium]
MKIFNNIQEISAWTTFEKKAGKSIGFVPTMGALHQGHLALVEQARKENDLVVCSIFVNPIQFNRPEDLATYPRTLDEDLKLLETVRCDAVFCPEVQEMYPHPEQKNYDFGTLDKVMEGKYRQGHFNGVAVVVSKLFGIVSPDRAYFGRKDFQQLQVIRALVVMEGLDVEIIACPTVREEDGLAMSSRNRRLSASQRSEASTIYRALTAARSMYPDVPLHDIRERVISQINASPELEVEYVEIVRADTLLPAEKHTDDVELVTCVAVNAGNIRLIDNMSLNS